MHGSWKYSGCYMVTDGRHTLCEVVYRKLPVWVLGQVLKSDLRFTFSDHEVHNDE